MAVLKDVRGIAVTVCVDKQALQEYDDHEPDCVSAEAGRYGKATKTVSKYIESTTGKVFYINLEISKAYKFDSPNVSFEVFVDGIRVGSKHGSKKHIPLTKRFKGVKSELDNGETILMPIKFSNITTSTDDSKLASIKEDAIRLSVVGEIVVKFYRRGKGTLSQKQSHNRGTFKQLVAGSSTSVQEKALKGQATSHSTTLGASQAIKSSVLWEMNYPDGYGNPVAIYRFKYRSRVAESLKSLLILERTPEPSPSPSPVPISNGASGLFDLDKLDATQKAKLQEAQSNEEKNIKREREETGMDSKAKKRSKRGERIEIDLTGDGSD
ncbi:hypothetical protein BPOR_1500g00010 [Botrytis porri]|uniref:DUF7918 domain-containing protein n=1 Tax=Botrytis porri TaxID=87229 RepID=A0A4Z1K9X7_9HELO|nr:hypothetical protein BPOR_1500g00010 [Botrytis porri]